MGLICSAVTNASKTDEREKKQSDAAVYQSENIFNE